MDTPTLNTKLPDLSEVDGFYQGLEIPIKDRNTKAEIRTFGVDNERGEIEPMFKCLLTLRPFSSITEEEKQELLKMNSLGLHPFEVAAMQTQYLCSRGIDCFKLIERGQAIEKK